MGGPRLKFGVFELDAAAYELRRAGRRVKLERLPMELLLLLVDRRGQVVTRDEILDRLWGKEVFLDVDNSINTAVSKVRLALRDDPDHPAFVRTIPGKGYRFIAPVSLETDEPAKPAAPPESAPTADVPNRGSWWWIALSGAMAGALLGWFAFNGPVRGAASGASQAIRSLAVLPLENLTGDPSQEYFADGMTDALITDLAQIGSVRVISRTSIARYKGVRKPLSEIARELDVDAIVEGTVTRSGGRVRVTSQLIDGARDRHLWARSYERDLDDVVSLQAEIAQAIAGEVRMVVTSEQRSRLLAGATVNPDAYDAYLKGRYYWNQRSPSAVRKSIESFQDAIERDPNFALAYAGLADAYNFGSVLGALAPKESAPEAKAAATKALVLEPRLAEAHAALGLVLSHYEFDFEGARREFLKAIELNPNYSNGRLFYAGAYLTPMGRHQDAIVEMTRALQLDPLSTPLNNMMAETYVWAGDYANAVRQFERTIELDPTFALAHLYFAGVLIELGKFEEAIGEQQKGELLLGANPEDAGAEAAALRALVRSHGARRYWQKNLERILRARQRAGARYVQAFAVAAAYARAGDADNAFKWLEKSFEDREGQEISLVRWVPDFKNLHADPRFASLLERMRLPH